MEEIIINKKFNTKEEHDKFLADFEKDYTIIMVMEMAQEIGAKEVYGIDSIWACKK